MITILLTGCFSFDSQNKLIKEAKDPTATNKATLFLKEGGATVSDSYQVSILHKDHKLTNDEVGNTFTVDANHGATWLTDNSINLIWKKKDTLQIVYDKKLRTFIMESKVGNVKVIYKPG